jgi:hypothetical protein
MSHWFRRKGFSLSAVLDGPEGTRGVLPALREFTRNHPQFACFACNRPIDRAEALDEIAVLFPNVDIDSLQRLSEKAESALMDISAQDARRLLDEALRLNESLYQSVVSWVNQDKPGCA